MPVYSTASDQVMGNTLQAGVRLLSALAALSGLAGLLCAQTPPPTSSRPASPTTQSPSPAKTPTVAPTPNPTPEPQSTPFAVPSAPGPSSIPAATPASGSTPPPVSLGNQNPQNANPLMLDEALRLANTQASTFQQAALNEQIAAEDVK